MGGTVIDGVDEGDGWISCEIHVGDGLVPYELFMRQSMASKEEYAEHLLQDLFDDLDEDGNGCLSVTEVSVLLEDAGVLEMPIEDIELLVSQMKTDRHGMIRFKEFRRVLLQDGRINRRSDLGDARNPCCGARARRAFACKCSCQPFVNRIRRCLQRAGLSSKASESNKSTNARLLRT